MSARAAAPRRSLSLLWPLAGAVALGIAFSSPDIRHLLADALAQISLLAVVATLPGQVAASLLCGAALFVLRPGVSFRASIAARLLRDAGANLLLFMPGLGDVIGTRALVLAGGKTRTAVTASALDTIAETLAQVPYAALALVVLPTLLHDIGTVSAFSVPALPWTALSFAALAVVAALGWFLRDKGRILLARLKAEMALFMAEIHGQLSGLPLAVFLHLLAWAMGGVQLWMAADVLGLRIGLFAAIVIESVAYAGRAVAFFVPAGLAVQEAGLVAAGTAYGLTPAQALSIALVLRLRDLVFGLPLLLWPVMEYRRRH